MGKVSFISGIVCIALGGILYTMERLFAVFQYGIEVVPVELNGSGSLPSEPNMPAIFDNFFVGLLLFLGLALLAYGIVHTYKNNVPLK